MKTILNFLLCIARGISAGLQDFNNLRQQNDFLREEREKLLRLNHELTLKIQALTAPKPTPVIQKPAQTAVKPNPHKTLPSSIPTQEVPRAG